MHDVTLGEVALTIALVQLALIFAVAGLSKALAPHTFVEQVRAHRLVPASLVKVGAFGLIGAELALGIWLISGFEYRFSAAAASVLLGAFLSYRVALRVFRRHDAPCGCFGTSTVGSKMPTLPAAAIGICFNLIVASTVAVLGPGHSRYSPTASFLISAALVFGLVTIGWLHRRTLLNVSGADEIEPFRVVDDAGREVGSVDLLAKPAIVLLLDRASDGSRSIAAQLQLAQADRVIDRTPLVVIRLDGDRDADDFPVLDGALFQNGSDIRSKFGSIETPHAFFVGASHTVKARGMPRNLDELRHLARVGRRRSRGSQPGTSYPAMRARAQA